MTTATVAVDPLEPGLGVVERRQQLAVAQRPVRAAEPGFGGAHDDADRHEQRAWSRGSPRRGVGSESRDGHSIRRRRFPTRLPLGFRRCLIPGPSSRRSRSSWSSPHAVRRPRRRLPPCHRRPLRRPRPNRRRWTAGEPSARPPGLPDPDHEPDRPAAASRILISLSRREQRRRWPRRTVPLKVAFYDLAKDLESPVATRRWHVRLGDRGRARHVRRSTSTCPRPGRTAIEFTTQAPGGPPETDPDDHVRSSRRRRPSCRSGDPAPASKTPTPPTSAATSRRSRPTPSPDPAFYQTSVADAIAAHKPFILVFATPKFCTSAQCGPTLDQLKPSPPRTRRSRSSTSSPTSSRTSMASSSRSSARTTSSRRRTTPTSGGSRASPGSSRSTGTGWSAVRSS